MFAEGLRHAVRVCYPFKRVLSDEIESYYTIGIHVYNL